MQTRALVRSAQRAAALSGALACGCLGYLSTRPWFARLAWFWIRLTPILVHYYVEKTKARNKADHETRYKKLHEKYAPVIKDIIGELRGMYLKVAQVLSVAPNLLPQEYKQELKNMWSDAPAADWESIRSVLEEDLGAPVETLFEAVDKRPLGAASIGQAHLVTWQGRRAVVKVQFKGAASLMGADFNSLLMLLKITAPEAKEAAQVVQNMRRQFELELDYAQEATHLHTLRQKLMQAPEFEGRLVIPAPIPELTNCRVLGMEYLPGPKLEEVMRGRLKAFGVKANAKELDVVAQAPSNPGAELSSIAPSSPSDEVAAPQNFQRLCSVVVAVAAKLFGPRGALKAGAAVAELRLRCLRRRGSAAAGRALAESHFEIPTNSIHSALRLLLEAQAFQIFFCPFFNADPHPGNILALPDGRIGLIDLGQCVQLTNDMRRNLVDLIRALARDSSEEADARVAKILSVMGVKTKTGNPRWLAFMCRFWFCEMRAEHFNQPFMKAVMAADKITYQPIEVFMLVRSMMLLRGLGLLLLENVNFAAAWRPWADRWLKEQGNSEGGFSRPH